MPLPSCSIGDDLPCRSARAWPTSPPKRLDDRLVAEADAERRNPRPEPPDHVDRDAGVGRPAGAGGDDDVRRRELLRFVGRDRIVPEHAHLRAELLEEVHEVVGERVVVVDDEEHLGILFGEVDRRFERSELVQALLVLGRGIRVCHDPGSRLQPRDASVSAIILIAMQVSSVPPGST